MTTNEPVYILGAGFVGSVVACELAKIESHSEIVLLFRDEAKVSRFENNGSQLTMYGAPNGSTTVTKFTASSPSMMIAQSTPINKLVIATKTYQTKQALADYLPLIGPNTDIVVIQNGLGVVDILYNEVWQDAESRPNIYQGVTNHGGFKTPTEIDEFHFTHAGFADLKIARVPDDLTVVKVPSANKDEDDLTNGSELIVELMKPRILNTILYDYSTLLVLQIEKFMVNSCINPITSIADCINGDMANTIEETSVLFRAIITESLDIFFKTMPALALSASAKEILNVDRLVDRVIDLGTIINAKNSSSMRQDCLNLRTTEIDFINGYVVKLAEANNLKAEVNKTVCMLVELRLALNRSKNSSA